MDVIVPGLEACARLEKEGPPVFESDGEFAVQDIEHVTPQAPVVGAETGRAIDNTHADPSPLEQPPERRSALALVFLFFDFFFSR